VDGHVWVGSSFSWRACGNNDRAVVAIAVACQGPGLHDGGDNREEYSVRRHHVRAPLTQCGSKEESGGLRDMTQR
jgi:hypothetical protein